MWAGRFLPCEVVTEWQSEQYESVTNVPSLTPRPRLCVSVMTHTPLLSRTSLSVNITAMKRRPVSVGPSLLAHKLIHIVTFSQATGQNCSVQKQEAAVLRCGTLLWEWNLFKVLEGCTTSRPSFCLSTMGMRAAPVKSNSQRCCRQVCDPKLHVSVGQRAR